MDKEPFCVAVIGSRGLSWADLSAYIPPNATSLVSGGAMGIDTLAEEYAKKHGLPIRVIRPNYSVFGKQAPLLRNRQIVECADLVIAVWDGHSPGTAYTVDYAHEKGVPVQLYILPENQTNQEA